MKTVAHTLEQLDNTLDTVEELIRELPIPENHKQRLSDTVHDLWLDVDESLGYAPQKQKEEVDK